MQPTYDFTGQVALVTGASSGMGLATTQAFAEAGVIGLTRSVALEVRAPGHPNPICPGTFDTPMVADMITKGELDEAAALALQPIGRLGRADRIIRFPAG